MHKFLCCLLSGLLAVAAVCLPIGSSVAAEQQISRTGITIPEDTVLQLELMNFLESKRNKVGDTVSVKLLELSVLLMRSSFLKELFWKGT